MKKIIVALLLTTCIPNTSLAQTSKTGGIIDSIQKPPRLYDDNRQDTIMPKHKMKTTDTMNHRNRRKINKK